MTFPDLLSRFPDPKKSGSSYLERRVVTLRTGLRYCVVGPRLALDFHFSGIGDDISAGLEMHYSTCPPYLHGQQPFTESCWLTGVRCFGDGTSLYATEYLYPLFDAERLDLFWPVLEAEWRRRERDAFPSMRPA